MRAAVRPATASVLKALLLYLALPLLILLLMAWATGFLTPTG